MLAHRKVTDVAEVSYISTIVAPLFCADITFTTSTDGELFFLLSTLLDEVALFVSNILIYAPKCRAFLREQLHLRIQIMRHFRHTFILWFWEPHRSQSFPMSEPRVEYLLGQVYKLLVGYFSFCDTQTLLIWPFMPHEKQVLLIGQLRVEWSLRAPHVRHWKQG